MSIQPAPWVIVSPSLVASHFLTCWQPASRRRREMEMKERKEEWKAIRISPYLKFLIFAIWLQRKKRMWSEKWESEEKPVDEEASYSSPLSHFLYFSLSQALLRVREVPGEQETNGGWHHDRTLHQSLQRLFGYLPELRKNCYSFGYILPGSAGTLKFTGYRDCNRSCVCVWVSEAGRERERWKVLSFFYFLPV